MGKKQRRGRTRRHHGSLHIHLRMLFAYGSIAPLVEAHEGSWIAGQCWIAAEGLLRWITISRALPPEAAFLVVLGDARCAVHHILVCVCVGQGTPHERRWYLDANGMHTAQTLLNYWQKEERLKDPFLAPYDEGKVEAWRIQRDGRVSTQIAQCLLEEIGRFVSSDVG